MRLLVIVLLLVLSSRGSADDALVPVVATTPSALTGRVLDAATGIPVEGAIVMISGPTGLVHTVNTDTHGRYLVQVTPGSYNVIFAHGKSRTSRKVAVAVGGATLDGKLDAMLGEVIVIRDKITPPTPPRATNFKREATPPYSDAAILRDAWTRAHLLLDIDAQGVVRRYKFLKRPGYDLEQIAAREVSKLTFVPAKDRSGKPMRAWAVWTLEWPSAGWLEKLVGTRTRMPPIKGFPPRRMDHYVPCKDSGEPWAMGSVHPTYKDCSKPDLRHAVAEPWVDVSAR